MAAPDHRLRLHEEVLLVGLHDEKGSFQKSTTLTFAMGGAILAELYLQHRLGFEGEGKKTVARIEDDTPTGGPILDNALAMVRDARKPPRLNDLAGRFGRMKNLRGRTADDLVELGVLRREEGEVLLIFPVTRYPEADPDYEAEINRRLADAIFTDDPVDDARTITLTALLHAAQMLPLVFDRRELKARRERIEAVAAGDVAGDAVKAAVQAMQAAIIAAAAAAATSAAVASS